MQRPTGTSAKGRRLLDRYAFAVACLVVLIAAILLIKLNDNLGWRELLSAIGLNLLASIVFAVIFATLSERVRERGLRSGLVEQFSTLSDHLRADLLRTASTYLPSKVYQAAQSFGESFNQDVGVALEASRSFSFKGTSAKYVAQRIRNAGHKPQHLRVITLDPSNDASIRHRAADRQMQPKLTNQDIDIIAGEIRNEIYMSLVSLFDIRHMCTVELLFNDRPLVTRIELFDDSVFVSWYRGPQSAKVPFPETHRFPSGSFTYEVEWHTVASEFRMAAEDVKVFQGRDTDADLCAYLTGLSGSDVTNAHLTRWRQQYRLFIEPFDRRLKQI